VGGEGLHVLCFAAPSDVLSGLRAAKRKRVESTMTVFLRLQGKKKEGDVVSVEDEKKKKGCSIDAADQRGGERRGGDLSGEQWTGGPGVGDRCYKREQRQVTGGFVHSIQRGQDGKGDFCASFALGVFRADIVTFSCRCFAFSSWKKKKKCSRICRGVSSF